MEFIGFFITTLIFVAIIGLYVLYVTKGRLERTGPASKAKKEKAPFLNKDLITDKWREVGSMMQEGGPANYRQAIMESDKLVDLVLKTKVPGDTMGERLKNARGLFHRTTYDRLWTAHKIRNKLAHESEFEGLSSDARLAVRAFEKALRELKVI
jgi:hypothetical protein